MSTVRAAGRIVLKTVGFIALAVALIGVLAVWSEVRLDRSLSRAPVWISGVLPPEVHTEADSVVIDVVSYNLWGLPFWLPDARRWERLPAIPERLRAQPADIIALQEAYDPLFRRYLVGVLGDRYRRTEDALCRQPMRFAGAKDCTGGLLTLSRFPILRESFYEHDDDLLRWEERILEKGALITRVHTPIGELVVVNVHLYAGRTPQDEAVRLQQIQRLGGLLDELADRPMVLVGDLNTEHPHIPEAIGGPPRTPTSVYSFLVDSLGFTDSRPEPSEEHLTYDPTSNPHGATWYHRDMGREIFDYIFVRVPDEMEVTVVDQRRVFDEDPPLSDHYGTRVRLLVSRAVAEESDQP